MALCTFHNSTLTGPLPFLPCSWQQRCSTPHHPLPPSRAPHATRSGLPTVQGPGVCPEHLSGLMRPARQPGGRGLRAWGGAVQAQ